MIRRMEYPTAYFKTMTISMSTPQFYEMRNKVARGQDIPLEIFNKNNPCQRVYRNFSEQKQNMMWFIDPDSGKAMTATKKNLGHRNLADLQTYMTVSFERFNSKDY